jgi:hypothetical protein
MPSLSLYLDDCADYNLLITLLQTAGILSFRPVTLA